MPRWPSLSRCCTLAALAYQGERLVRVGLQGMGMTLLEYVDEPSADIHGYLASTADGVLVWAWRGTDSCLNALEDADLRLFGPPGRPWRVHQGFWRGFVASAYAWHLQRLAGRPLIIVGHSLGGALATIAARQVVDLFPEIAIRTFGSPRVGDAAWAKDVDEFVPDHIRVVHDEDVVPRLPAGFGYQHCGRLLHLNDAGTAFGPMRRWWSRCRWAARLLIGDLDGECVRDHFVVRYQETVNRWEVA